MAEPVAFDPVSESPWAGGIQGHAFATLWKRLGILAGNHAVELPRLVYLVFLNQQLSRTLTLALRMIIRGECFRTNYP